MSREIAVQLLGLLIAILTIAMTVAALINIFTTSA